MFNVSKKIKNLSEKAMSMCETQFEKIEKIVEYNQQKVLKAFIDNGVSERHFIGSTGYGYGDIGRDTLDKVFAQIFEAEDSLVRHNFVSGTHAITVALFGILRPGDKLVSVTGTPYDTMQGVIGINKESSGSLKDFGVIYDELSLTEKGLIDFEAIKKIVDPNIKIIYIQRSRGYSLRPSLSVSDIKKVVQIVKKNIPKCIVILDNCYGEFVCCEEPLSVGVDLIAGSLIKNPGGAIASTGGYLAGKKDLIEKCSFRLTTPGTGKEVGATFNFNRQFFMGIFNAPHVTGEALKTAVFSAALFELLGYEVFPKYNEPRNDIIQILKLGSEENLISFCQSIQAASPIDSFVKPEPWDMPGYDNKVVMAAGTFTLGSSIELSADAPIREPFAVFLQGGFNFYSSKIAIMLAADKIINKI